MLFSGGRGADIEGERLRQLLGVAAPLLAYVGTVCDGRVRAISVRVQERVMRATYDASDAVGVVRIDGERFDHEVMPLCEPVLVFASGMAT